MPRFEPFTSTTVLPEPGAVETITLEFKSGEFIRKGTIDRRELAKDVATFANALGGVLIVGAEEDTKRGVLGTYRPLTEEEVKQARNAYSEAVRDHCRPKPIFESTPIARGDGAVVAVNVWPFPGQAVGVRKDGDAYAFPLRTGSDCTYLSPEQLPMLMIPELRRVVGLLYAIPLGTKVEFMSFTSVGASSGKGHPEFRGVDELKNSATFAYGQSGRDPLAVPLDMIKSVWCDQAGKWHVTASAEY